MTERFTQRNAPLFEGLVNYTKQGIAPFHMPGHRAGKGLPPSFRKFGGDLWKLDLTELTGLNLGHEPDFLLKAAEKLAAEAFGADRTFFLVNGASSGIIAALLGLGVSGGKILVDRDCHLSVVNGLVLADLHPVFIPPAWVEGLPVLPPPEKIGDYLDRHPDAEALFLTNPGYHGIFGCLEKTAALANRLHIPLLVDEAHGGHLKYFGFPCADAGSVGADLWVWGVHKMMGSLTQTGMLHIKSGVVDLNRTEKALETVGTTSPSYILLASLDAVRRELYYHGEELFLRAAWFGETIRRRLANIDGIRVVDSGILPPGYGHDPTKVVISLRESGWDGISAEETLYRKYKVQPEYADRDFLYFFLSYAQEEEELEALIRACRDLAVSGGPGVKRGGSFEPPPWSETPLPVAPRTAFFGKAESVPLEHAAGRVAAGSVAAYPPGIPLWIPGEMITPEMTEWASGFRSAGGYLKGVGAGRVTVLTEE